MARASSTRKVESNRNNKTVNKSVNRKLFFLIDDDDGYIYFDDGGYLTLEEAICAGNEEAEKSGNNYKVVKLVAESINEIKEID